VLATALRFDARERTFADLGTTGPAEVGVARGMEKALEDFLAGYAEKRKKALAEAMARIVAATPRNRGPRGEGLSATGFWGAIEW